MYSLFIEIPSSRKNINNAEPLLREAFKCCKLPDEDSQNLAAATSEIILNCIVHGNFEDNEKTVFVKVEYDDRHIAVTVNDEGNGFDIDKLPDPTAEENIFKEHGRGIFIVRTLVDDFNYKNTGHGSEFRFSLKKK